MTSEPNEGAPALSCFVRRRAERTVLGRFEQKATKTKGASIFVSFVASRENANTTLEHQEDRIFILGGERSS